MKIYTMTSRSDDGVELGETVFSTASDDASALRAAMSVAKGYARHNGTINWQLRQGKRVVHGKV